MNYMVFFWIAIIVFLYWRFIPRGEKKKKTEYILPPIKKDNWRAKAPAYQKKIPVPNEARKVLDEKLKPSVLQGTHSKNLKVIFDEGSHLTDEHWGELEKIVNNSAAEAGKRKEENGSDN